MFNQLILRKSTSQLSKLLLGLSIAMLMVACNDTRNHPSPHEDFYQVGLFGHGRGALGDMKLNYFGLERRCDTCHRISVDQHGDLGTCNRCHQPHIFGWKNTLFSREHATVMSFEDKSYHAELACVECHNQTADQIEFKEVSCNHCHNHGRSDIDYAHDLMDDYEYKSFSESSACVSCHTKQGENYSKYYDPESDELL